MKREVPLMISVLSAPKKATLRAAVCSFLPLLMPFLVTVAVAIEIAIAIAIAVVFGWAQRTKKKRAPSFSFLLLGRRPRRNRVKNWEIEMKVRHHDSLSMRIEICFAAAAALMIAAAAAGDVERKCGEREEGQRGREEVCPRRRIDRGQKGGWKRRPQRDREGR